MAGAYSNKRKVEEGMKGKTHRPVKKFKKQTDYHSDSSEDEVKAAQDFPAVNLQDSDEEGLDAADIITGEASGTEEAPAMEEDIASEVTDASSDEASDSNSDTNSNPNLIRKRKRNDPDAFATSMSKILGSKLATSKRADPVLARSATAIETSKEITDQALERKARSKMKDDKRAALEKGRVKDVLGASTAFDAANGMGGEEAMGVSVQETMELEKKLRKTAQRGVVKLFNAVRAAQVQGEEAAREARVKGLVGHGRREEKVNEMSKKGFLDLVASGGGGLKAGGVGEA
ncbi:Rrp15p-domain-containing protein [Amylocarpus encephaloides]|uniref:Rrp15p-domain-containing protein n=1 Tax=Amylocarpus encephaloides TaxID=45428 RepID=A0A9P8C0C9_9HELO|nr:Rrp15p-domain-containing protein [Amylocarpus encephaloides]